MPKLSEIATALRNVADAFEKNPDVEVTQPALSFYFWLMGETAKPQFLDLASVFPRPFKKAFTRPERQD